MTRSLLLALALLPSALSAQPSQTWAHEESDLPVDENAIMGELENGFRYLIYPNAEPPGRVSLRLHVDAGSLREEDDQQGMAHFLEHMLFEGSKNYTSAELIPEMQRLGIAFGAHANAYTSFDETVYMLDLPNLEEKTTTLGFTVMRDFCDGALLQNEEVEKERGVILSEKNSRDSVDSRLMKQQFEYLMPDHLVSRRFPIGIEKTIKECPQPRIKQFYEDYYDPRLMTFIVVGDVDPAEYKNKITEAFGTLSSPEKKVLSPAIGTITEPTDLTTSLFTDKEVDEEDVSLIRCYSAVSLPDTLENRVNKMPLQIANAILSKRFEKIAKSEGSPLIGGGAYKNTWFDMVSFGSLYVTPAEGKWRESVSILEQEYRRALEHGFTKAEYREVTERIRKQAELAVEAAETRQSSGIASQIIPRINDRKVFTTAQTDLTVVQAALEQLSVEHCHTAFKDFWHSDHAHLILTTTEDSGDDASALKSLFLKSKQTPVTAPEEKGELAFAYDTFGEPSSIIERTEIEDLGVTQFQLKNGVRVNVKKTDFEKGKLYIQAHIQGGAVTAPTTGLTSFTNAIFTAGGVGKHDADDLQQILSGNAVATSFTIEEDAFTFNGLTNQEDLTLQLQLICAYLTDASYRDEAVRLYKKALPDQYDTLSSTLEGAFQYYSAFSYGNDPRFKVPTEEAAAALTTQQAQNWLTTPLSTAPLELTIVGDLDLAQTEKSVLASVGTLPQRKWEARAATPPLEHLPQPPMKKTITYTSELDRAAAVTAWRTQGINRDISQARRMNILARILTNRMREKIREELGSSYSPYARSSMSELFPNYGNLSALSICKSADTAQINKILLQIGDDLAKNGASQDELDRALNPVLEQIEASVRQNSYWLATVLNRSQAEPHRLIWARSRTADYTSITLEQINALAAQYMKSDNAINYDLRPKTTPQH